MLIYWAEAYIL